LKETWKKDEVFETTLKARGLSFDRIASLNKEGAENNETRRAFKELLDVCMQLRFGGCRMEPAWQWKEGIWAQICLLKTLTPVAAGLFPEEMNTSHQ